MFMLMSLISPVDVEFVGLFSPILLISAFFLFLALLLVLVIAFFIFLGRLITGGRKEEQTKVDGNKKEDTDSAIGFALQNKNIRGE